MVADVQTQWCFEIINLLLDGTVHDALACPTLLVYSIRLAIICIATV